MNTDVFATRVIEGIAVITLGSATRMYFDSEMGDALTESLQEFSGDPNIRVVIVTGGTPGYFNRHFSIPALIEFAESVRASGANGRTMQPTMADSSTRQWRCARPCPSRSSPRFPGLLLQGPSSSRLRATFASLRTATI